jgi:transposase-like protein
MVKMENETYLSTAKLADRWGMHPQTLRAWRAQGKGPTFEKRGRAVRYALSQVEFFERSNETVPTPKE